MSNLEGQGNKDDEDDDTDDQIIEIGSGSVKMYMKYESNIHNKGMFALQYTGSIP